jgi:hypothetical protein
VKNSLSGESLKWTPPRLGDVDRDKEQAPALPLRFRRHQHRPAEAGHAPDRQHLARKARGAELHRDVEWRSAIFHAENRTKSWSVVAVGDDLIEAELGDDPDSPRIQSEYRHAEAMWALIRQAETERQTTPWTLRRSPAGSA